jgi:hypothetical protein
VAEIRVEMVAVIAATAATAPVVAAGAVFYHTSILNSIFFLVGLS